MGTAFRYEDVPIFDAFERVSDPTVYTPLPDDWQVGAADVVRSTDALKAGRYKAVNMAGASVVAAVRNALKTLSFPYVFGGDGAVIAIGPESAEAARRAMAATANFVASDLDLTLRVGMLSVGAIRAAGHDMRVARYAASPQAVYAMFSGGGASYAEAELKAGRIAIEPVPKDARPDLDGLSCRWSPLKTRQGVILSVLVMPASAAAQEAFRNVAAEVVRMTQGGHPVPPAGPDFALNPAALRLEARATKREGESAVVRFAKLVGEMLLAMATDRTSQTIGRFDPKRYRSWVARNTDFRKFDDGLRMTVDCSPETAAALERLLADARAAGIVEYGLHRQDAALMTCIVPSPFADDHVHFLDGAGGGYALAAQALKGSISAKEAALAGAA